MSQIKPELKAAFTDENADAICEYIIEKIRKEGTPNQLEYDFHVSGQTGQMLTAADDLEKNTWFKFQCDKGTALETIMKAEFDYECNEEELHFIDAYHSYICQQLVEKYAIQLEDALRLRIFMGKNAPLRVVKATAIDLVDFSSCPEEDNYNLIIEKEVPKNVLDNYSIGSVSPELIKIHAETGKDFNVIIKEKKEAGDPNYDFVKSAFKETYIWNCQIDLFVDFSGEQFAKPPELKLVQDTQPEANN